jgi:hypothetical protein
MRAKQDANRDSASAACATRLSFCAQVARHHASQYAPVSLMHARACVGVSGAPFFAKRGSGKTRAVRAAGFAGSAPSQCVRTRRNALAHEDFAALTDAKPGPGTNISERGNIAYNTLP